MRMPSMKTSGSLLSDRLLAPRTRSCAPVPTCPVAGSTMRPGVRAPSSCSTLRGGRRLQHLGGVDGVHHVADRASLRDAGGAGHHDLIQLRGAFGELEVGRVRFAGDEREAAGVLRVAHQPNTHGDRSHAGRDDVVAAILRHAGAAGDGAGIGHHGDERPGQRSLADGVGDLSVDGGLCLGLQRGAGAIISTTTGTHQYRRLLPSDIDMPPQGNAADRCPDVDGATCRSARKTTHRPHHRGE